jgi:multiple sugar transport system permease protein
VAELRPAKPTTVGGWSAPVTRRWRRRSSRRRQRVLELLFLLPAVAYLLLFFGYPVVKNAVMGFQHVTTSTFFTGEAPWVGLDNYTTVIGSAVFSKAAINTLLFTAGSIAGQFSIGLAIALYFQRKFPLSGVLRSLLLLPWLIPLTSPAPSGAGSSTRTAAPSTACWAGWIWSAIRGG